MLPMLPMLPPITTTRAWVFIVCLQEVGSSGDRSQGEWSSGGAGMKQRHNASLEIRGIVR
jgi:hypothetical protein